MFVSTLTRRMLSYGVATFVLSLQPLTSQAALSISGTRVVIKSDQRSVSIIVRNPSKKTYAAQAWVNTEADDTTTAVPLIASPPLFRLDPGKDQQVQINALPNTLPSDRESLFYFNVQEIPQTNDTSGNALNIAIRTRIKLFYRPHTLEGGSVAKLAELQWFLSEVNGVSQLIVRNPTPYHVSFVRLDVMANGKKHLVKNPDMSAPLSERAFELEGLKYQEGMQVVFSTINDYGAYTQPLTLPIQAAR